MAERMNRRTLLLGALAAGVLAAFTGGIRKLLFHETPVERAQRLCSDCDLKPSEVNGLIEAMRVSSTNRDELLRRYKQTYVAGRPEPVCLPCIRSMVDAVLEARDE